MHIVDMLWPTCCGHIAASETQTIGCWDSALLVESEDSGSAQVPSVAVDRSGNAIAAWCKIDGTANSIWANRYLLGFGWGTSTIIERSYVYDCQEPSVAVDDEGNAVTAWVQFDGIRLTTWANRYVVGTGWLAPTLIGPDDLGNAHSPRVIADSPGNATVVWTQSDGLRTSIWTNRYTVGIGWGIAAAIENNDSSDAWEPDLAKDGKGNAIAVWHQYEGNEHSIRANRYVVGVGWETPSLVRRLSTGSIYHPRVAADALGNAMAVWSEVQGVTCTIWSSRYETGLGWIDPMLVMTDDTGVPAEVSMATDGFGNATAVWDQYDRIRFHVLANPYVAGVGWGTPMLLETDDSVTARNPWCAMDISGNAMAVWAQEDVRFGIWSRRYVAGVGWGSPMRVETVATAGADAPRVVLDGSGNAMAIWLQSEGVRNNIWSSRCVAPDVTPPMLSIESPEDGFTTDTSSVTISGVTEPGATLVVNGLAIAVGSDGAFSFVLPSRESQAPHVYPSCITRAMFFRHPIPPIMSSLANHPHSGRGGLAQAVSTIQHRFSISGHCLTH